jgi:hypothetical protein
MKPAAKPEDRRKGKSAKVDAREKTEKHAQTLPNSVRQWAKEAVKKTPVDTGEGGSGQP